MKILLLAALGLFACVARTQTVPAAEPTMTQIYAGFDWYRERPEAEREWRGLLGERHVSTGPAAPGARIRSGYERRYAANLCRRCRTSACPVCRSPSAGARQEGRPY